MKVAIFDNQLNNGGGKRFLLNLLAGLAELKESPDLTFYHNPNIPLDAGAYEVFQTKNIAVRPLKSITDVSRRKPLLKRGYGYAKRKSLAIFHKPADPDKRLSEEIASLSRDFDVAYFPWPYTMRSPETHCPKVATFHDFNFNYFFGTHIFSKNQTQFIEESFENWMQNTVPVVSTHFMQRELASFYPRQRTATVIHLPSLNPFQKAGSSVNQAYPDDRIKGLPYIVFPVHLTSHKNIGNVIAAVSLVNAAETRIRLVLTGGNTDTVCGESGYFGMKRTGVHKPDVLGLGYISDERMHHLLKNALAVINASFYEAGNGVGLDAWAMGVPVLQSNIPAFEEHLTLQGFKAFTFDPRNANDIARAIQDCLEDTEKREAYITTSIEKAKNLTWNVTAAHYYKLFEKTTQGNQYAD